MSNNSQSVVVFPGQGSQKVGMLSELSQQWPQVQETFSEASEVLGYDLWALIQDGPQEELNLTEKSQPALLASSVAIWRVIQQSSQYTPKQLAGHSLGEWSALVCAGVLDFKDAIKLVQLRGRYMQEAVPVGVGAMAAIIGLADDAVVECCQKAAENEEVSAVNYNSPGQVVIAGHKAAVDRAMSLCKEAGAKRALPLAVSAPFHTALMKPAAERLALDIQATTFRAPLIPVVHNVHGRTESDPEAIKALMVQQIYSAVMWVDCVNALSGGGTEDVVECGPGKVLCGLVKRINKQLQSTSTDAVALLESIIKANQKSES